MRSGRNRPNGLIPASRVGRSNNNNDDCYHDYLLFFFLFVDSRSLPLARLPSVCSGGGQGILQRL